MPCSLLNETACLTKIPVFRSLTGPQRAALQPLIQTKRYARGDYIFREGTRSEYLYLVHDGAVKLSKCAFNGKEQLIRFLFQGDFFGQFALLHHKQHYADAEVLEPSAICMIHRTDFLRMLEQDAQLAYQFTLAISELLHQADEWSGTLGTQEARQRLAKLLLLFLSRNGMRPEFDLPVPKKDLAAMAGTTPETLSRTFAALVREGVIHIAHKRITIHSLERLQELAQ